MTAQISFCGDTHGEFEHRIDAVREYRPAVVIFLGDLQLQKSLEIELVPILDVTEICFVHGNHDTDSNADYDNLFGSTLTDRNLHGKVLEVAGLRIAGLGGIFRGKVWAPPTKWNFETQEAYAGHCGKSNLWRNGLPRKHRSSIFPADYFTLTNECADLLVTHEAPSAHPHGWIAIDELARSLKVRTAFHGHHHDCLDYHAVSKANGFNLHGVGLRGISDETGAVIVRGQCDRARQYRQKQS